MKPASPIVTQRTSIGRFTDAKAPHLRAADRRRAAVPSSSQLHHGYGVGLVVRAVRSYEVRRQLRPQPGFGKEGQMNRRGFTLIELLIVVVIIGILAAIAIPAFANTKGKAYIASMKSDMRNLVTAEEAYFADSVNYTTDLGTDFAVTTGNVLGTIALTADGWTATVTNTNYAGHTCAIFVGTTAIAPATKEGEPACN
jgi:prepilin-type N-terminal cleavage/methylation domain-containing protein